MITSRYGFNGQAIEPFIAFTLMVNKRLSAQKLLVECCPDQSLFLNAISSY
jgi:hypothetical protein